MYEVPSELPFLEQRRWALTRRANKLLAWLEWERYATYVSVEESVAPMARLISIISDALGSALSENDWLKFRYLFAEMRNLVYTIEDQEGNRDLEIAIYGQSLATLRVILEEYKVFIKDYEFE